MRQAVTMGADELTVASAITFSRGYWKRLRFPSDPLGCGGEREYNQGLQLLECYNRSMNISLGTIRVSIFEGPVPGASTIILTDE